MPDIKHLYGRAVMALLLCLLLAACGGKVETPAGAEKTGPEVTVIADAARAPDAPVLPQMHADAASRASIGYPPELYESSTSCYRLEMYTPYTGIAAVDGQINLWTARLRAAQVKEFNQICADSPRPSELFLAYETSATFGNAISVLFLSSIDTGGAHPTTLVETLSFDTRNGNRLAYEDIFGNTDELIEFFSDYTRKALRSKLSEFWDMGPMFSDGLLPKPENFMNFALTPEGLVLIFPQYQLAPYSEGIQSCLVPLAELVRFSPKPGIWH